MCFDYCIYYYCFKIKNENVMKLILYYYNENCVSNAIYTNVKLSRKTYRNQLRYLRVY